MSFLSRIFAVGMIAGAMMLPISASQAADQNPPDAPVVKAPKKAPDVPFFFVNDNRLTYSYIFTGADAGSYTVRPDGTINGKTAQQVVAFTHFDVWAYGTNFFTLGMYKSDHNDPAAPCTNAGQIENSNFSITPADCAGATEIYGIIRSTFGFNEIFDTKMFRQGPLSDVSFEVGADFDNFDGALANSKRAFVAGLQFAFDLPYKGYFNVAPLAYYETNHNAFTQCGYFLASPAPNCNADGNIQFQPTWALELNWYMDLGFLPPEWQYFAISGRASWIGPKGNWQGLAIQGPTKVEFNSEPIRLTFDAGKALWGPKYTHEVDLWVAYRYWQNEYGDDANAAPFVCTLNGRSTNSCTMSSAVTGVTVKF
jgi:hypothetical protein